MTLNEFINAFQTEQQCLAYIANLKENKCIRCFSFNLNTSDLKRILNVWWHFKHLILLKSETFKLEEAHQSTKRYFDKSKY